MLLWYPSNIRCTVISNSNIIHLVPLKSQFFEISTYFWSHVIKYKTRFWDYSLIIMIMENWRSFISWSANAIIGLFFGSCSFLNMELQKSNNKQTFTTKSANPTHTLKSASIWYSMMPGLVFAITSTWASEETSPMNFIYSISSGCFSNLVSFRIWYILF